MNAPVKEKGTAPRPPRRASPSRSSPAPRRACRTFPSSTSRSYNYFKPQKMRATVYEDVTTDVQPDPERHLTQGWLYGFANGAGGYPHDWTALQEQQLAHVPRPQRGVGADDLPQQLQHRAADRAEPAERQGGRRLRALVADLDPVRRRERRCLDARRAGPGHARVRRRAARSPDQHDQQRDLREQRAPAAVRPGPRAVQPGPERVAARPSTARSHRAAWKNEPVLAGCPRERRAADRDRGLGRGGVRDQRGVRAAGRRAVPQRPADADRRAQRRLHHPDADRRRRERLQPRPALHPRAVHPAGQRREARRGQPGDHAGLAGQVGAGQHASAARELQPIWSQPPERTITFAESFAAAHDRLHHA